MNSKPASSQAASTFLTSGMSNSSRPEMGSTVLAIAGVPARRAFSPARMLVSTLTTTLLDELALLRSSQAFRPRAYRPRPPAALTSR